MAKYNGHSLQLTEKEEEDLKEVQRVTGFGVKKIFMAMVYALKAQAPEVVEEKD